MKTTEGKKRPARRPSRSIRIHSMPSGNRVEVRYATSLKKGLEEFYQTRLKSYTKVSIVGNILLVADGDKTYEFRAYEEEVKKKK